jgi:glycosyltransferase involved in cell wall biosynthesis
MGEGFGLSLIEGAACGIPIVCPAHGNLEDIWGYNADYIDIERSEYVPGTRFKGDVISTSDFAEKLNRLYEDRTYLKERKVQVFQASGDPKFNWSTVADKVFKVLMSTSKTRLNFIG